MSKWSSHCNVLAGKDRHVNSKQGLTLMVLFQGLTRMVLFNDVAFAIPWANDLANITTKNPAIHIVT